MLPSHTRTRSDPRRTPTEDGGIRRKQADADGSRKMAGIALASADFRREFGPGPVGFPDMISRRNHHGPQTCCHQTDGPDAARNGSRREIAEADGRRRKLTEAENDRNSTRVGLFSPQIWPRACWVAGYARPISSSWPQPCCHRPHGPAVARTEADGRSKMAYAALESADFRHKFGPWPVGCPDILSRHQHHGPQTCCHQTHGPDAARSGS